MTVMNRPQTEYALILFQQMVEDEAYVEFLKRHYRMTKASLADGTAH
jgi:hypothetical protein